MSDRTLRNHLIRTASLMTPGSRERRDLLALLAQEPAPAEKQAGRSTADFASWVLTTTQGTAIAAREVQSFVKGLGVSIGGGRRKPSGARWQVGYRVCIKAEKHKGGGNEDGVYDQWDRKIGVIVDDGGGGKGDPVTVRFGSNEVVFPNAQRSRGVGMYKATDWSKVKGHGPIEIIYKANPSSRPTPGQEAISAEYIERGEARGQKRSLNYYSGYVMNGAIGKNGFYMSIMAQQRISQDPCDDTYPFRSFNPDKGQVLYIGRLGKRPKGWEQELEEIRAGGM